MNISQEGEMQQYGIPGTMNYAGRGRETVRRNEHTCDTDRSECRKTKVAAETKTERSTDESLASTNTGKRGRYSCGMAESHERWKQSIDLKQIHYSDTLSRVSFGTLGERHNIETLL